MFRRPCHRCRPCSLGYEGVCEHLNVIGTQIQGDYAEYMLITEKVLKDGMVRQIPDHLTYEETVLTEPLSSVYACQEDCDVTLGDTVIVIGLGPIGSLHTALAKIRGAARVIAVEQSEKRLEKATEFGADSLIDSSTENPVQKILEITDGWGAEKVIVACPSTEAQKQAVAMACKHGTVVFFGGVPQALRIVGHFGYVNLQASRAFSLIESGRLEAKKFVTHILPLEDLQKAIGLTRNGEAIKIVLSP